MKQEILDAFGLSCKGEVLEGGQNESMLYGDAVLKPVGDAIYYSHVSAIFDSLKPTDYRISRPLKTVGGSYVAFGYGATRYEAGYEDDTALMEKLEVSRCLHRDLSAVNTEMLPLADDPWGSAHKVIWWGKNIPVTWSEKQQHFFHELIEAMIPCGGVMQIIHSDLGGNILLHDTLPPLVIDFSPTIAPREYGEAILICDSIAWAGQPLETISLLGDMAVYKPYIQRAILFRVLTVAFLDCAWKSIQSEWEKFEPIWYFVSN